MRRLAALHIDRGNPVATVLEQANDLPRTLPFHQWHSRHLARPRRGQPSTQTHAGIQLLPAALAEAEMRGLSGTSLLEAVILAYEASARIWRATKARLSVHPHGTYGPVAAAIALAKLRGDNASAIASAINIAAALGLAASRMTLNDGATVRNIYTGHSARAGFQALALRDAGFTGEADAVASIMGNIYGSEFDAGAASAELGKTWWIRRSYFKRFATGRYAHGALDLTEELANRLKARLSASAIERIDVETFFWAATLGPNCQDALRLAFLAADRPLPAGSFTAPCRSPMMGRVPSPTPKSQRSAQGFT